MPPRAGICAAVVLGEAAQDGDRGCFYQMLLSDAPILEAVTAK